MEFFDTAIEKAKEAIDVACKKTNEVVAVQKQRFDIASMESKLEKDYAVLGKLGVDYLKSAAADDENIVKLIADITDKQEKLEQARIELAQAKNKRICPKCGASVERQSTFCNYCGEKLVYEEEQDDSDGENKE